MSAAVFKVGFMVSLQASCACSKWYGRGSLAYALSAVFAHLHAKHAGRSLAEAQLSLAILHTKKCDGLAVQFKGKRHYARGGARARRVAT